MKHKFVGLSIALIIGMSLPALLAFGGPTHEMEPYVGSTEFEQIKGLAGEWSGQSRSGDRPSMDVTVTYRTTANGSAVVETLFKDSSHEMVSVYYEEDGKVVMTHYCAVANQPKLALESSSGEAFQFGYVGGTNLNPDKDLHISALKLAIDEDSMRHEWTGGVGKDLHTTVVTLKRVD